MTEEAKKIPMVQPEDVPAHSLAVKIPKTYNEDFESLDEHELQEKIYECTRGMWKLNAEKAQEIEHLIAVYNGHVIGVFKVAGNLPAGMIYTPFHDKNHMPVDRREFYGKEDSDEILNRLLGKDATHFWPRGDQNPVRYLDDWKQKA